MILKEEKNRIVSYIYFFFWQERLLRRTDVLIVWCVIGTTAVQYRTGLSRVFAKGYIQRRHFLSPTFTRNRVIQISI